MKKIPLSIFIASTIMTAPIVSANNDFSYISAGFQLGRADNELFNDQTESALGGFVDISWNFYDNIFASYSLGYNSYDGSGWEHTWYNGSESGRNYFSSSKQYYSLGYFVPMNKFTPYVSLGVVDYNLSGSMHEISSRPEPGVTTKFSDTVEGAAGEVGTYYQVSKNYKVKFAYNYSVLEDQGRKVKMGEFYFGNDYAFTEDWSAVANVSSRDVKVDSAKLNEVSMQVGVKYNF